MLPFGLRAAHPVRVRERTGDPEQVGSRAGCRKGGLPIGPALTACLGAMGIVAAKCFPTAGTYRRRLIAPTDLRPAAQASRPHGAALIKGAGVNRAVSGESPGLPALRGGGRSRPRESVAGLRL